MIDTVDLTLNRDFRKSDDIWIDYLNRDLARAALGFEEQNNITMYQHATLNLFESFFGKPMTNEYWKVREQWIIPDLRTYFETCVRCGKTIKIPWGRQSRELCNECFNKYSDVDRFPWRPKKASDNNVASELFGLI